MSEKNRNDLISRQAVLDAFSDYVGSGMSMNDFDALWDIVVKTQSVNTQEPKTGHWKVVSDGYGDNAYICECSECKDTVWVYKDADRKWNYCPNCGCRMSESKRYIELAKSYAEGLLAGLAEVENEE